MAKANGHGGNGESRRTSPQDSSGEGPGRVMAAARGVRRFPATGFDSALRASLSASRS